MVSKNDAIHAVETLVRYIEDSQGGLREGLSETPRRVVRSFDEIFSGYQLDSEEILDSTFNAEG